MSIRLMVLNLLFAAILPAATYAETPDALPHSQIARGAGHVAEVRLIDPTQRYDHFVLGDRFEAAGFWVRLQNGATQTFRLPNNQVFEDRVPRLFDVDKDGRDELVLILSEIGKGASVAIYELDENAIDLKAQTSFIGQSYRWLNIAGIADFDGDGHIEIALVAKPHLTKELQFWRLDDDKLKMIFATQGFSNHAVGLREQRLSTVFDDNGNGVPDLALPNAARTAIHIVTLVPQYEILRTYLLADELVGPLTKEDKTLIAPLKNGTIMRLPLTAK